MELTKILTVLAALAVAIIIFKVFKSAVKFAIIIVIAIIVFRMISNAGTVENKIGDKTYNNERTTVKEYIDGEIEISNNASISCAEWS